MTERSLSLRHPGGRSHGVYPPIATRPCPARQATGLQGFLKTLFDFSVSPVVTTRIIKMPCLRRPRCSLFIIIVMAFWRLFLRRERGDR